MAMQSLIRATYPLERIDFLLVASSLLIAIGGVFAIHAATFASASMIQDPQKQAIGVVVGALIMGLVASLDYTKVLPRFGVWIYWINLLLLTLVVVHGHSSHGAQRWIPLGPIQFQPSEFAKVALIICLALYLTDRRDSLNEWRTILGSLAYIAVPTALVFKQPDLGTALVILTVWIGMITIAGAPALKITIVVAAGILMFVGLWHTPLIKDYQKTRLTAFVNPTSDPRDTGYHLIQSKIAIGSGEALGQGYLQGMQATGHFIPEQHTDFIFTLVGEETGLLGCCILIGLYGVMLQRCLSILIYSDDLLGRLMIAGIVAMFAFHIIVNIGMTVGIMPVTGVPLPFFSYGLSSLLGGMTCIGLALSVRARGKASMFD